jgi:hypothetical protein
MRKPLHGIAGAFNNLDFHDSCLDQDLFDGLNLDANDEMMAMIGSAHHGHHLHQGSE